MLTAVTVALAGPVASALWPESGPSAQTVRVSPDLKPLGQTMASCGGVSPKENACRAAFNLEDCLVGGTLECGPQIRDTLGFTGTVRASLFGHDPRSGAVVSVWEECELVAGQVVGVGRIGVGDCPRLGTDAVPCPDSTPEEPCVLMRGPFSLGGLASPLARQGAPVGPWKVELLR